MTDQHVAYGASAAFTDDLSIDAEAGQHPAAFSITVALRETPPAWLDDTLDALQALAKLPQDWDSYGATPIVPDSISCASTITRALASLVGVDRPEVGAGADGLVGLSWDAGKWSLDVTIRQDSLVDFVYIDERNHSNDRDEIGRRYEELIGILTQLD